MHAVRLVAEGETLLFPAAVRALAAEYGNRGARAVLERAALTEREEAVLRLMARGLTNVEIASELIVGTETVKSHVSAILAKLGGHGTGRRRSSWRTSRGSSLPPDRGRWGGWGPLLAAAPRAQYDPADKLASWEDTRWGS
ncbi:hypothetical protein GCM10020254_18770 [Streptomyces goshikiensis]